MIPATICSHFWPVLRQRCDAGLRAPADCDACPAYHDGTPYLGPEPSEARRVSEWAALRSGPRMYTPQAWFRGQS